MIITTDFRPLRRPLDKIRLGIIQLRDHRSERLRLRRLLCLLRRGIPIIQHGRRHEEKHGLGIVRLYITHELYIGSCKLGGIEYGAHIIVAEVVSPQINHHGIGRRVRGERVTALWVVGAIVSISLGHNRTGVRGPRCIVARDAYAAPRYDAVVRLERVSREHGVRLHYVFERGGVGAW